VSIEAISSGGGPAAADTAKPGKVAEAAGQFEALLIGQLLRSMREASEGWLGTGEDQAGATMLEVAEEHLARVLSAQGGLGLASLVVKGLEPGADTDSGRAFPRPAPAGSSRR
jgi:Rod binding domain-containing protein